MSCRERNAWGNQDTFPCNPYIDVANASPWCMYVLVGESGKVEHLGKSWKSLKEWVAVHVTVPEQLFWRKMPKTRRLLGHICTHIPMILWLPNIASVRCHCLPVSRVMQGNVFGSERCMAAVSG
jgi:hypothetical protein